MQKADWSSIGDNNKTTCMALPGRPRSPEGGGEQRVVWSCFSKMFHVSDKGDKGSSVRENGWVHLKLHITRRSISFVLEKSSGHTVLQPQLLQLTISSTKS